MFERFTDPSRRVVRVAAEEAQSLNHNYLGTEHLLAGLAREEDGYVAELFKTHDITIERVREQIEEVVGRGGQIPIGHKPFTLRAKKVLELSLRQSIQLERTYIGPEHLLLGLIDAARYGGEAPYGVQILLSLGADPEELRKEIILMIVAREGAPA